MRYNIFIFIYTRSSIYNVVCAHTTLHIWININQERESINFMNDKKRIHEFHFVNESSSEFGYSGRGDASQRSIVFSILTLYFIHLP